MSKYSVISSKVSDPNASLVSLNPMYFATCHLLTYVFVVVGRTVLGPLWAVSVLSLSYGLNCKCIMTDALKCYIRGHPVFI